MPTPTITNIPGISGVHHYYESFGRDLYMYTLANVMLEGGLTGGRCRKECAASATHAWCDLASEWRQWITVTVRMRTNMTIAIAHA